MLKLSFETFRIANSTRSKRFFEPAVVDQWSPADTLVGMIGELGEACNVMKKLKRAELGMVNKNSEPGRQVDALTTEVRRKLMEEFAGTILYFDQLAEAFGIDFEQAITITYNEKSRELGFAERIVDGQFVVLDDNLGHTVIHPRAADHIHDSKYGNTPADQIVGWAGASIQIGDALVIGTDGLYHPTNTGAEITRAPLGPTISDDKAFVAQKAEFDAVASLARTYNNLPPIVDDSYPEARHYYERAVRELIIACTANGRIERRVGKSPLLAAPFGQQPFTERRVVGGEDEATAEDFSNMTFSVDVEFSQRLEINHGDRLKVHIKDGKAVSVEVKERTPAAMIITEHHERRTGFAEQAKDDEIAIIYAPKDRGSEIDPPDDYNRLMTITVEENPLISVKKVARGIRKGLKKKFKEYRFKTEAIM